MPSAKYHREQAQVLAGLALSTNDPKEMDRFTQAAMEHLELAQTMEAIGDKCQPHILGPRSDKYADGA
jgi:hypothetical protein